MKHFARFKILFCIVILLCSVQSAAAEQIYIPGTAYGGVQYTAQQSGIYTFTFVSGSVRGPDCGNDLWCGCCVSGQPCWSGIVEIYVNRSISWGPIISGCPVVPSSPDYILGTEHFWTVADAEAALKGTSVEIPLHGGDTLNMTLRDFETSYGDNTGGVTLDVSYAPFAVIPLPGYPGSPTDPDGDGIYEDLNGNGRLDFADIVLYFNQMTWIAANEPIAAFDLNGNGRIDFADIVQLFGEI